jgi:hypothetical protein
VVPPEELELEEPLELDELELPEPDELEDVDPELEPLEPDELEDVDPELEPPVLVPVLVPGPPKLVSSLEQAARLTAQRRTIHRVAIFMRYFELQLFM